MYQEVASVLGLRSGKRSGSLDIARSIEEGFPASSIDHLKRDLGITDKVLSTLMGNTPKTLGRIRADRSRLSSVTSDRLFRVARIYVLATEVFESADAATEWLRTPQIGLGDRTPLSLLATGPGTQAVQDLLIRIEHGVIS